MYVNQKLQDGKGDKKKPQCGVWTVRTKQSLSSALKEHNLFLRYYQHQSQIQQETIKATNIWNRGLWDDLHYIVKALHRLLWLLELTTHSLCYLPQLDLSSFVHTEPTNAL